MKQSKLSCYFEGSFTCPHCGRKFNSLGALRSHITKAHSKSSEEAKKYVTITEEKNNVNVEMKLPTLHYTLFKELAKNIYGLTPEEALIFFVQTVIEENQKRESKQPTIKPPGLSHVV